MQTSKLPNWKGAILCNLIFPASLFWSVILQYYSAILHHIWWCGISLTFSHLKSIFLPLLWYPHTQAGVFEFQMAPDQLVCKKVTIIVLTTFRQFFPLEILRVNYFWEIILREIPARSDIHEWMTICEKKFHLHQLQSLECIPITGREGRHHNKATTQLCWELSCLEAVGLGSLPNCTIPAFFSFVAFRLCCGSWQHWALRPSPGLNPHWSVLLRFHIFFSHKSVTTKGGCCARCIFIGNFFLPLSK